MGRGLLVTVLSFAFFACAASQGQSAPCPASSSGKLICLIPELYGPNGIALVDNGHKGHFETSFVTAGAAPLSSAIGVESTLLPLASPSSGITFSWDPAAKVFSASTDSFGPVLGERAETIGRHRVFVGFSYQYFKFDTLDGLDLRKGLPVVLTHQDDFGDQVTPGAAGCSINAPAGNTSDSGTCGYVRDVIKTNNRVDLKVHQFNAFFAFGLTDKVDLSIVIPIEDVRMGASSDALIVDNSGLNLHQFASDSCAAPPCFSASFSNAHDAAGLGDITLRLKGTAWKGERAAAALGAEVRLPTGDELNFLGAGAVGVRPFAIWSYRARISPHALLGYQFNASSVLAGDISTGGKARLPSQVTYSGGIDVWLTKRVTAAVDLIGQQVNGAHRLVTTPFTELPGCRPVTPGNPPCSPSTDFGATGGFNPPNTDPNVSTLNQHYNITDGSVGVKLKPFGNFLITANATFKLNDGGLRAKVVPLVAVSYTF